MRKMRRLLPNAPRDIKKAEKGSVFISLPLRGAPCCSYPPPVPRAPYGLFIPLTASRSSPTLGEQFAIRSVRKLKVFQLETIPQGLTSRRDSSPKVGFLSPDNGGTEGGGA